MTAESLEILNGFSATELARLLRNGGESAIPAGLARREERIAVARGIIRREMRQELRPLSGREAT